MRELYNRASRATQVLLEIWNTETPMVARSLGEAIARDPKATDMLLDLISAGETRGFSEEALKTRLTHFTREDARVPAAAQAFAHRDGAAIGALAADSQRDADTMLGNQVPETRELVRQALSHGALAASAFGAGFGGSVWALVDADYAQRFARDWLSAYSRLTPHIAGAECFVARPGPSLTEVPR